MKISLISVEIITEQISIVLIIPKSLRRIALTIANANFTFCAEHRKALTSFEFLQSRNIFVYGLINLKIGGGHFKHWADFGMKGISNDYNSSLWSQMDKNGTN